MNGRKRKYMSYLNPSDSEDNDNAEVPRTTRWRWNQDLQEEESNSEGNDGINDHDLDEVEFPQNSDMESSTESGSGTFSSQSETEVEDRSHNGEAEDNMDNNHMNLQCRQIVDDGVDNCDDISARESDGDGQEPSHQGSDNEALSSFQSDADEEGSNILEINGSVRPNNNHNRMANTLDQHHMEEAGDDGSDYHGDLSGTDSEEDDDELRLGFENDIASVSENSQEEDDVEDGSDHSVQGSGDDDDVCPFHPAPGEDMQQERADSQEEDDVEDGSDHSVQGSGDDDDVFPFHPAPGEDMQQERADSQEEDDVEDGSDHSVQGSGDDDDVFPFHPAPEEDMQQDRADDVQNIQIINQPNNAFVSLKALLEGPYSRVIQATPQISTGEILLNALTVINHFKFNHSQAEGIMMLVNTIFKKDVLPPSRYLLDKLLKSSAGGHYHFICIKCNNYLKERDYENEKSVDCDVCGTVNNIADLNSSYFFVIYDIPIQLEILFSDNKKAAALKNPLDLLDDDPNAPLKDLYNGQIYQKLLKYILSLEAELGLRYISFCASVDGSPLFKTNHVEIWPLFLSVLELPPAMRAHNLLLGGMWVSKKKPIMDIFLDPFIRYMNDLSSHGFHLTVGGEDWYMKSYLLCLCADAPARAAVQSIHQHNGSTSCNWCLHPGEIIGPGQNKFFVLDHIPELRTSAALLRDGTEAARRAQREKDPHVRGATGVSPIHMSCSMDAVDGMILDLLHHFDHGIGHQVPASWLGEHGAHVDYYIGAPANLEKMDALIDSIRLPIEARRPARRITEFAEYQARDHQNFNLLFGVPLLLELNIEKFKPFLKHWMLFVQGAHLLLQSEISHENVNLAHRLLSNFVLKCELVYGEEGGRMHMTYNMHITLHAAQNAARFGPPWALNAYCFEAGNKTIKEVIFAGKGIPSQICRALSQKCALQILESHCSTPDSEVFKERIKKTHVVRCIYIGDDRYLGVQRSFLPSDGERWLCNQQRINIQNYVQVEKVIHNECVYAPFKKNLRTNNSIAFLNDRSYVYIDKIIVSEEDQKGYLIVKRIHTAPVVMTQLRVPNDIAFLRTVQFIEDASYLITSNDLRIVCARISLPNGDYLVRIPNVYNTC